MGELLKRKVGYIPPILLCVCGKVIAKSKAQAMAEKILSIKGRVLSIGSEKMKSQKERSLLDKAVLMASKKGLKVRSSTGDAKEKRFVIFLPNGTLYKAKGLTDLLDYIQHY